MKLCSTTTPASSSNIIRGAEVEDQIERFDYSFDKSLIATAPMRPRDRSRLLVYDKKTENIGHLHFSSILDLLRPNDLLIVNNTRVFPARLFARKGLGGGKIELLLLRETTPSAMGAKRPSEQGEREGEAPQALPVEGATRAPVIEWEALVKGHITIETVLTFNGGGEARLVKALDGGRKVIAFTLPNQFDIYTYLKKWGEVPLPPYILQRRKQEGLIEQNDDNSYQTVYAKPIGSAAAPTAGLHFTKRLIAALRKKGVTIATVTLNIGIDTFKPIGVDRLSHHKMSGELFEVSNRTANAIARAKASGGRIIAVGTSATRAIESAANAEGTVMPTKGETKLFISPGYTFRGVDGLITNFHPPRATGLVLVSAFLGYNAMSRLYREALEKRYRLFSYGDAMLIV
ncbi:MAG: tRNA preQ1(34) S-adenosylmethionine ribosyltransferase-isomerase QueA [Nitrospirae bacterium]|nr:tRNA preQ1(34) S-adenosylmethionine ribosyltransferase-isomerase QueA [Candidatus Troglogloeales bacterium]